MNAPVPSLRVRSDQIAKFLDEHLWSPSEHDLDNLFVAAMVDHAPSLDPDDFWGWRRLALHLHRSGGSIPAHGLTGRVAAALESYNPNRVLSILRAVDRKGQRARAVVRAIVAAAEYENALREIHNLRNPP